MSMQQYSILILVVGFTFIGFILYLAYKVAEHKDKKADERRRVTNNSK
jgi:multisubunit Na+/H+ antiporter MnhC subunit